MLFNISADGVDVVLAIAWGYCEAMVSRFSFREWVSLVNGKLKELYNGDMDDSDSYLNRDYELMCQFLELYGLPDKEVIEKNNKKLIKIDYNDSQTIEYMYYDEEEDDWKFIYADVDETDDEDDDEN